MSKSSILKLIITKRDTLIKCIPFWIIVAGIFFPVSGAFALGVSPADLDLGELYYDQVIESDIYVVQKNPSQDIDIEMVLEGDLFKETQNKKTKAVLVKGEKTSVLPFQVDLRGLAPGKEYVGKVSVFEKKTGEEGASTLLQSGGSVIVSAHIVQGSSGAIEAGGTDFWKLTNGKVAAESTLENMGTKFLTPSGIFFDIYDDKTGDLLSSKEYVPENKATPRKKMRASVEFDEKVLIRDGIKGQVRVELSGDTVLSNLEDIVIHQKGGGNINQTNQVETKKDWNRIIVIIFGGVLVIFSGALIIAKKKNDRKT